MCQFEVKKSASEDVASEGMLARLTDDQLILAAKSLAAEERALTARLLECLSEMQRRGLHLARGYSSLFLFCIEGLGFTESQAHARISAMKLSQELPEVVQKVASGELSLTNASAAQVFFRQEKKVGKIYSKDDKRELVQSLEGLSTRQCERKLAELSPETLNFRERERPVSAHQTELRIIADDELMRDLQRLKELWSHSLKDGTYAELLKKMAKLSLEKADPLHVTKIGTAKARVSRSPKIGAPQFQESRAVGFADDPSKKQLEALVETVDEESPPLGLRVTPIRSRHIPRAIARQIWQRDQGRCVYVDPRTGRRCDSKHRLQLDHLKPFAWGGEHSRDNLRLACQAHNLWRQVA